MDVINNLEDRQRWIDALESGDYKKGRHGLRSHDECHDEYCCLGVLAEINGDLHEDGSFKGDSIGLLRVVTNYSYYGLTYDYQRHLSKINDKSDTFEPVIEAIKAL